jgi:hypothetical protein
MIDHATHPGPETAAEQLDFIESMIREGRKSTEYWGWNFLLWGVAYLVAMTWANLLTGRAALWAWPVTMTVTGVATALIARWRNRDTPITTTGRAITAVWMGAGLGIFVFAFPLILAGRFGDGHAFLGGIEVLLGAAHIASGVTLRWPLQISVGAMWWTAAIVTEVAPGSLPLLIAFLTATFLGNICFGIWLMYLEARDKARLRSAQVSHA